MQANGSKCPLDADTVTGTDNDNEKGVWGKTREKRPTPTPTGQETGKFKSCLFLHIFHIQEENSLS